MTLQIAGGTVTGSLHQHKLNIKNNQDAFAWHFGNDNETVCTVICDGCGSSKHSEVGAKIFSQILASWGHIDSHHFDAKDAEGLQRLALQYMRMIVCRMRGNYADIVRDYFLFTINGVMISKRLVTVFSIGDGMACLNGNAIVLPEYPNNAPPYLAYELIKGKIKNPTPDLYKFRIHTQMPTEDFEHVLIGSDGIKDLAGIVDISEFWTDDKYFQNPDQVRRRLAMINKRKGEQLGPLVDDTTLVVIRKRHA